MMTEAVIRGGRGLCYYVCSFDELLNMMLQELAETKAQLEDQKRAVSMLQDAGDSSQSQAVEVASVVFERALLPLAVGRGLLKKS